MNTKAIELTSDLEVPAPSFSLGKLLFNGLICAAVIYGTWAGTGLVIDASKALYATKKQELVMGMVEAELAEQELTIDLKSGKSKGVGAMSKAELEKALYVLVEQNEQLQGRIDMAKNILGSDKE